MDIELRPQTCSKGREQGSAHLDHTEGRSFAKGRIYVGLKIKQNSNSDKQIAQGQISISLI